MWRITIKDCLDDMGHKEDFSWLVNPPPGNETETVEWLRREKKRRELALGKTTVIPYHSEYVEVYVPDELLHVFEDTVPEISG